MTISYETIAPWPLFPHTFVTGANGNRISQQYLILVISRRTEFSVTECWYSYFNGVLKISKICINSKRIFENLSVKKQ